MITQCPKCQKTQEIPDIYRGREIKCLHCKEPFTATEWVQPNRTATQCQHCKHIQYTFETNIGKVISCGQCGAKFRADPYIPPPEPEIPYEQPAPALCGALMFFAWAIGIISALALIPTVGASFAGIIFALLLAWAAQVLRHLAKK